MVQINQHLECVEYIARHKTRNREATLLKTKKIEVSKVKQTDINLATLAGITVVGGTVFLTDITEAALETGSVVIPQLKQRNSATTRIRSLQQKNQLMVVSLDGPFTTPVRDMINILGGTLEAFGSTATFLPATTQGSIPGRKYFGFASATQLRNADERIHNVRLLGDGMGLLFTQKDTVHHLPLHCVPDDWVEKARRIHEAPDQIQFLGRIEGSRVPVTLTSGETYFLQVDRGNATPEPILAEAYTKVFGTVGGTPYLAALKGDELVFAQL